MTFVIFASKKIGMLGVVVMNMTKMLNYVNEHYYPKSKDVYNVAKDIFEHSNKDYWIRGGGLSEKEAIESIMFELYNNCVFRHFTIVD